MFTWICPQCGREVPPAYTDCPNCAPGQQAGTPAQPVPPQPQPVAPVAPPPPQAAPAPPPPPPAAPVAYPPPVPQHVSTSPLFAPPPQPSYAPQPVPVMQARVGLPTWLMSIIFALAFLGVGACVYWTVRHFQGNGQPPATTASGGAAAPVLENVPPAKPAQGAAVNPMQKYVEVVGVRLLQNSKKQTEARFLLVNHSSADAADLSGTVAVLGRTQKEGDEPVGRFTFKNVSLGPYESKELSAPVDTKLRVYELPDWQMTVTQVQLTAP